MGCDAYHPVSKRGSNLTQAGGIGYMVLDAIDSLILLGLDEEYQRAREWVATELSFDRSGIYNTFEVGLPSESTRMSRSFCVTVAYDRFPDNYSCIGWTAIRV
jgi:hypothetical protein